jgi:rhodanese-related sulfurtransferase
MDELPSRDTPLVIACDQGLRAPSASRILKDSGWRKLYTLIDGMEAYKGELERPEG